MNIFDIKQGCIGCGACVDSCPTNVLTLAQNKDGFYEPILSKEECSDCGKCTRVCPLLNLEKKERSSTFYYGWSNNEQIRQSSSSGGAFSMLAKQMLSTGGVVFGAKYNEDFKSVSMTSTEESSINDLRKSKYCQSKPNGLYKKISKCLKAGKPVMLTGTPCQIAAARRLFGYLDNLLLVDFLCGGVVPETMLNDYATHLEKKYKSKISSMDMRDKSRGWSIPHVKITFNNGKKYLRRYQLDYYYYYYTPLMKNEQCLSCPFTNHSDADITIADFWGYRAANVKKDDRGLSLVCAHTVAGKNAVHSLQEDMTLIPLENKFAAYGFKEKNHSEVTLLRRTAFMEEVRKTSFVQAAKNNHFKGGRLAVIARALLRKGGKK